MRSRAQEWVARAQRAVCFFRGAGGSDGVGSWSASWCSRARRSLRRGLVAMLTALGGAASFTGSKKSAASKGLADDDWTDLTRARLGFSYRAGLGARCGARAGRGLFE